MSLYPPRYLLQRQTEQFPLARFTVKDIWYFQWFFKSQAGSWFCDVLLWNCSFIGPVPWPKEAFSLMSQNCPFKTQLPARSTVWSMQPWRSHSGCNDIREKDQSRNFSDCWRSHLDFCPLINEDEYCSDTAILGYLSLDFLNNPSLGFLCYVDNEHCLDLGDMIICVRFNGHWKVCIPKEKNHFHLTFWISFSLSSATEQSNPVSEP